MREKLEGERQYMEGGRVKRPKNSEKALTEPPNSSTLESSYTGEAECVKSYFL